MLSGGSLTGNNATIGGAIYNGDGGIATISNCMFTGNTATTGGAIYNAGTLNVTGAITLATASDTVYNSGTLNWDLRTGDGSNFDFSISDWSLVSGTGAYTVTVTASQTLGSYSLAGGVSDDFAITLKGLNQDYALSLNGTNSVTVDGTYYGLSRTADSVSLQIAKEKTCENNVCGGTATHIAGGTTSKMFVGGNVITSGDPEQAIENSCAVSVTDGAFGDSFFAGNVAANGITLAQTGNVSLDVAGGTFSKRVSGGMYVADETSSVTLEGDVNFAVKGGNFAGRIFGGCNAQQDAYGEHTTIDGSVNVTVDSSQNEIYVGNYLIGGSRGAGKITGSVTVTFTGLGSKLNFNGGTSIVAGGSNADYVKIDAQGVRTTVSAVDGDRNLVFDNFTGDFAADLRLFSTATIKNGSTVTLTDARVNLWSVETWNFAAGSTLAGLQDNDFEGDTLHFDLTGWDESDWTAASGGVKAFDDLDKAAAVWFGTSEVTEYDAQQACWTDGTYKLALNSDKTAMVVSKIA